ncbi:MAG: response regulator [Bacteroidota bacterium]|nr:response regulator [Bacteroidota bacterium]
MDENPLLIIDDDEDDLELIKQAAAHLKSTHPIIFFKNGSELTAYLKTATKAPFLIISDVNLPGDDGFAIRRQLLETKDFKYKSIPYIFWSTAASEKQIQYAYDLPAQGFFFKSSNFDDLCSTLQIILEYWKKSQHPKKL